MICLMSPLLRRKHVRFLQFEISLESSWSLCFIFSSTISVLETSGSESNSTTKLAAGCRHRRHCVLTNKAQTKMDKPEYPTCKWQNYKGMDNLKYELPLESSKPLLDLTLEVSYCSEMMPKWYVSCPSFAQETCQISAIWNFARVLLIALFHILFHHLSFGNFWLWIQFYHQVGCRHRRHCVLTNKAQTKWTNQNIQHANDKTTKVWTIWSMNCLWKVPNLCWISLWKCHIVAKWCQNDMSHVPLLRRKHVRFLQFEISLESLLIALFHILFHHLSFGKLLALNPILPPSWLPAQAALRPNQ